MIVKKTFNLLKDIPNILQLSSNELKKYTIEKGSQKLYVMLQLRKDRINHYAKEKVFLTISDLQKRKKICVVNMPDYNLHVSYNKPTNQIIINISPFLVDDISMIDPKNLYAQLIYGISFYKLVTGSVDIKNSYFTIISSYLLSMFISIFGKEYGLFGFYSTNISKLSFLVNCYVLNSFFGIEKNKSYKLSSTVSSFNYKEIEGELNNYDFSNIESFIKSLSELKVLPGINRYYFTSRIVKTSGVSFLPALEDLSRFISILTCVGIKGSNLIYTYISKYNEDSFGRVIDISKLIFK